MNTPIIETLLDFLKMLFNSFIEAKGYIYILIVIAVAITLGVLFKRR